MRMRFEGEDDLKIDQKEEIDARRSVTLHFLLHKIKGLIIGLFSVLKVGKLLRKMMKQSGNRLFFQMEGSELSNL